MYLLAWLCRESEYDSWLRGKKYDSKPAICASCNLSSTRDFKFRFNFQLHIYPRRHQRAIHQLSFVRQVLYLIRMALVRVLNAPWIQTALLIKPASVITVRTRVRVLAVSEPSVVLKVIILFVLVITA